MRSSAVGFGWLVEAWASFPTAEAAEDDVIVKLDFVIPLGRG